MNPPSALVPADNALTVGAAFDAVAEHPMLPEKAVGATRSRLKSYIEWLGADRWMSPDLPGYVEHLRSRGIAETTISAHLSTIREQYRTLALDRDLFYNALPEGGEFIERKAVVDEIIERIRNAAGAKIKLDIVTVQDESDLTHIRLSKAQADELLHRPGIFTKKGARNTAMIALMLCTGIREQELCDVTADDLEQRLDGELALQISRGKGKKQRLVPYGELAWCLNFVHHWLRMAKITEGAVFRRIRKNGLIGTEKLSTRSVQLMLSEYKILHGRRLVHPRPHDLRRSYARRLWEENVDPIRIQQNLGHAQLETTLIYIGALDGKQRRPPAVYTIPADLLAMMEE